MSDRSEPEVLKEKLPESLATLVESCALFFSNYGWYLVFLTALILFFWPQIDEFLDRWYIKRQEMKYAAKYHKDPDWVRSRNRALEESRRRMQDELDRKSAEFAAKMAEKEEKKRLEKLEQMQSTTAHRLGGVNDKNKYKPEYNPLSGDKGGGYRAPKRSCPGSGCG